MTTAGNSIYFAADRGSPGQTQAVTTFATYATAWGLGIYAQSPRAYTSVVEERTGFPELADELRQMQPWLGLDGIEVADRGDLAAKLRGSVR